MFLISYSMNKVQFDAPDTESLRKEYFVADMHHHTKYSHDSNNSVNHLLDQCEEKKIYLAITDHNTISGVLCAYQDPRKKWIIPGIEVTVKEGKDVLVYFYSVTALKAWFEKRIKPHMKRKNSLALNKTSYPMKDFLLDLQEEKCLVILPHPCCVRAKSTFHYFQNPSRAYLLECIHAIEVINETMTRKSNLAALGWAMSLAKPFSAGSDGHRPDRVGEAITYAKAKNKTEFLDAIKKGKAMVRGTELKPNERLMAGVSIVLQKSRVRNNHRLDSEEL